MLAWNAPVSVEADIGDRLGPYRLERLLGQGGFGMVYLAEQLEPVKREVAVKLIKPGMDTRQVIARFATEQQTLASLDHPGIAHIFDAGVTPNGRPYFVMEYVPGESITTYCQTRRLNVREILRLVVRVCEAVQYAHQRGVIHRDLKPSNILVANVDGTAAPKIIDFGVAKAISDDARTDATRQTVQGQILGTPEYMSPEQAELGPAVVDTRSDVYSLGAVLYELLTGQRPFDGKTLRQASSDELRRVIREIDPPRPSTKVMRTRVTTPRSHTPQGSRALSRRLRGDLDWITMRAMHKERDRRYESASALAADIRRHVAGRPVLAGPPSAWYRARKFIRRNRGAVSTAGLVGVALLVGMIAFVAQFLRASELNIDLQNTVTELDSTNKTLSTTTESLREQAIELRQTVRERDASVQSLKTTNAQLEKTTDDLREQTDLALAASENARTQARIATTNAVLADEQRRRAEHAAYANEVSRAIDALGSGDLPVFVRSLEEAQMLGGGWEISALAAEFDQSIKEVPLAQFGASAAAIMPGGKLILMGDDAGSLRFVDPFEQRVEEPFGEAAGPIARIAIARETPRAATLSRTGKIQVWDLDQRRLIGEHRVLTDTPSAIALSAGGQWLAVGDAGGRVTIRDAATGEPIIARKPHETSVQTIAFSPDDLWLISCSHDRDVARISTAGWVVRRSDAPLDGIVRSIAFSGGGPSDDAPRFLTGDESGAVIEWSLSDHKPLRAIQQQGSPVLALAENLGLIVGGTGDLGTRIWWTVPGGGGPGDSRSSRTMSRTLTGHESSVRAVSWIDDDPFALLTIDAAHVARVWKLELTTADAQAPRLHDSEIVAIGVTQDARYIITASADATARTWHADTLLAYEPAPVLHLDARPLGLGVSAESAYVLDASGVIRRWDPLTGSILATRILDGARVLAVRPRDALLIVGDDAGAIHLLDGESLRTLRVIDAHDGSINAIAVSADGARAISVADDANATVWELERFTPIHHLGPFAHRPVAVAIDRLGRAIAVGDDAGFIHVDAVEQVAIVATDQRRHDPRWSAGRGIGPPISAIAFSPDGSRIISTDRAGVATLWAPGYEQPIARIAAGEMALASIQFMGQDDRLLAGRGDGRLRVWRSRVEQPRLDPAQRGEQLPVNAAIVDAFCVSVSGERIVPVAGEPFSIGVQVRATALAGQLLELTRTVEGSSATSRESAGSEDESLRYAVSGAWVVDRPGVHEATVSVRVLGDVADQIETDDTLTIRFQVRER